jgi:hypothetical protein
VEIQIDASPGGSAPFTVEGDGSSSRLDTDDPETAIQHIERLLGALSGDD